MFTCIDIIGCDIAKSFVITPVVVVGLNPKSRLCLDPKEIIDAAGYHLLLSRIFFVLGIILAVLGIISDAINTTLGLESMSWFLLAIGVFVAGIVPGLGWAVAVYLKTVEGKKGI